MISNDIPATIANLNSSAIRHETPCGDGHMVWREWGKGQSLVLLHGGSGSWRHWLRNIEALSEHYRVITADMPGFHSSAAPHEPVSFDSLGKIMGQGLDLILEANEAYHIAGFSLGSFIAPHVVSHSPNPCNGLVLVHGHLIGKMDFLPHDILKRWRDVKDPVERRAILRHNLGALMLAHPQNADDATIDLYREDVEQSRLRVLPFINTLDTNILKTLNVPLCSISGRLDPTAKPDVAAQIEKLRAEHPDAECHIVENAGHWVMYEEWKTFNKLILKWLVNNS